MKAFVQFDEAYAELVLEICRSLRRKTGGQLAFIGIAIRRETVRKKIDPVMDEIGIQSYEWWNRVEHRILNTEYKPERLEFYRKQIGDKKLRALVSCCREIGIGLVSGGVYAKTGLRKYVESGDDNRWNYITGVLDYYYDLLSREAPDFIFFNEITFPWELGASFIADLLGIPCLVLCLTRSGGGYLITDNPYQRCPEIEDLFQNILAEPAVAGASLEEALLDVETFRAKPVDPEYMAESRMKVGRQSTVPGMLRTLVADLCKCGAMHLGLFGTRGFLRQENWWENLRLNLRCFRATRRALRGRDFEEVPAFQETNYLYCPLHVEPEATTMVLSDRLTNQLFFIEQLSKSMPAGYKLLVKEHVPMLGRRPNGFYSRIRNLPDVHLISPFSDNFELIRNAMVVCVLSGTAGWEAIELGVPVLVVGDSQYLGIGEGFVRCENLFRLDEDIRTCMSMPPVSMDKVAAFIAATKMLQSDLTPRSVAYWHYGLDPEEVIPQEGVEQLADQILEKAGLKTITQQEGA
jgi:hypothetical protein